MAFHPLCILCRQHSCSVAGEEIEIAERRESALAVLASSKSKYPAGNESHNDDAGKRESGKWFIVVSVPSYLSQTQETEIYFSV